jgi:dCTP deaminase
MTILSRDAILRLLDAGRLVVTPLTRDQVGPTSIDLTLGNEFRVFKKVETVLHVQEEVDYAQVTELIRVEDGAYLLLMPGELVHGITRETIRLPRDIAGWIEGRSRFARIGLMIHVTAGLVQPGCDNRQVLEISNMSPVPLALYPSTRICQLILEVLQGEAEYRGKFRDQVHP